MSIDLSAEQVDPCLAQFLSRIHCMTLYPALPQFSCLLKGFNYTYGIWNKGEIIKCPQ